MKVCKISVVISGFFTGALIWWASPAFTGKAEPWDAEGGYYALALILAGLISALPSPRHFWLVPLGIYLGQLAYAFGFLPSGPLWAVGLVFAAMYCILALIGGACAFGLWRAYRSFRDKHPTSRYTE